MNGGGTQRLGIDVGGTNIKLGLVSSDGRIGAESRCQTRLTTDPHATCEQIVQQSRQLAEKHGLVIDQLAGIGIAFPGILDTEEGVLREVSNLSHLENFPLRDALSERFGRPISLINDANAAALAEHVHRGLGNSSSVLVTLGTGIGCGVVMRGLPYGGDHGCAGEIGHIRVFRDPASRRCGCGKKGHLESYAGAEGVVASAREMLQQGGASSLRGAQPLTPQAIANCAAAGDDLSLDVIRQTAELIGLGISMLAHCLDPQTVFIGGAMTFGGKKTKTGQLFLSQIAATIEDCSLKQISGGLNLAFAELENAAGMIGAAEMAVRIKQLGSGAEKKGASRKDCVKG